ncbi:hypothetical protein PIROE2DRAFT_17614 [Piromyces sp. E2]|nr:hypothetical protein PIROE2DRAFT_17614 [Piromyces sp. E2]|eukprot:OUM57419.1 hypothetical protein PIROE2DRAFT_17614 [Piromyces sp. E2]
MDLYQSYPNYTQKGGSSALNSSDHYEHEEKRSTGNSYNNRVYEEPMNKPQSAVSQAVASHNEAPKSNGKETITNIKNEYPNDIDNNNSSSSNSDISLYSSKRAIAVDSAVATKSKTTDIATNTVNIISKSTSLIKNNNTNSNSNINTNSTNSNINTISYDNSNIITNSINNNINTTSNNNTKINTNSKSNDNSNSPINNNKTTNTSNTTQNKGADDDTTLYSNNLLNLEDFNSQNFRPKPLTKSTLRAPTYTVTRTYTRTYTRSTIPTNTNTNSNLSNNNRNTNTYPTNNNLSNNRNSNSNAGINRNVPASQSTKTIPPQYINNNPVSNAAVGNQTKQPVNTPGQTTENVNNKEASPSSPDNTNTNTNTEAAIIPDAASYGHLSTSNKIEQDINQVQSNNNNDQKNGSKFTFVIILIVIPIIIIITIASIYFYKKYKKGKRGSNIVYPDDKIRKSNLFGTLQFWNANKPIRASVSSGSHDSRGSRTNLTSVSNDRESKIPEYSEWLEAGEWAGNSNTASMPPVSPPQLVTDDKVNGLTGSNYAMGVNLGENNNNGTLTSAQINKPQAARMAWKLEGMRVGRDSTQKICIIEKN